MDTIKVNITDVRRGSLLVGWAGKAVADTLSADGRGAFWRDRSSGKHYADPNGKITVYVPTVRIDAIGKSGGKNGAVHALKSGTDTPVCPNGQRSKSVDVWEAGTALASVTCGACRKMVGLMTTT
jgi:hypothetical protein